jgi:hypothetical protein
MSMLNSDINSDNIIERITDKLGPIIATTLTTRKNVLSTLDEIRTVNGWYQKAKKNPNEIPSIIADEAIKRLLEQVVPEVSKHLKLEVNLEINRSGFRVGKTNIKIDFVRKPFVEFIQTINGVESPASKVTITFKVVISGYLEGIAINRNVTGLQVNMDRFNASLTISIIEVGHSTYLRPIDPPITLCSQEIFKVQHLSCRISKHMARSI